MSERKKQKTYAVGFVLGSVRVNVFVVAVSLQAAIETAEGEWHKLLFVGDAELVDGTPHVYGAWEA